MCLATEWTSPSQGSAEILSRPCELLFAYAMRQWAERPDAAPGWLTGARDPVIAAAITAIQAQPEAPWTVERLAAGSNLSRSAFAERFARRVGQPSAAYIAHIPLERASDLLVYTTAPTCAIASDVGHVSKAAFSCAFSKPYAMSPSRWQNRAGSLVPSDPGQPGPPGDSRRSGTNHRRATPA
jgi:transcriptional regulator GlxA family with amidase domain